MSETTMKRFRWASRILGLLGLLGGILAAADQVPASVHQYAALATALLLGASRWCEQQLPPTKSTTANATGASTMIIVLAILAVAAMSCRGPYHAAWATMRSVVEARDQTAHELATSAKIKHADCLKAHGENTPEYATCIKAHREALRQWRQHVRPAVNSALHVASASVQIAERAKDKTLNWIALVRPAVCALLATARQWGHLYPEKGKRILGALSGLEAVACH